MDPDATLEREFATLARKLQAARGFCFVVYFVEDARASRWLASRLAAHLESLGRALETVAAVSPDQMVAETLTAIFDLIGGHGAERPVVWVEAYRGGGEADWDAQRRLLLMRMNERRSRFESAPGVPLVLLLPAGAQRDAASLAPDLWHVRLHSAVIAAPAQARTPAAEPPVRPAVPVPAAHDAAVPKEVRYWESLHAAARGDADALASLPLWDGFNAVAAWLAADRPDRALPLANTLVDLARQRVPGDAKAHAADLAMALRESAAAKLRSGQPQAAIGDLDEAVGVLRGLGTDGESDPVVARALVNILASLGEALLGSDRADEAAAAFMAAVDLTRSSMPTFDAQQRAFVATLLTRLGDARAAARDDAEAMAAYRSGIEAWAQARTAGRDEPAWLRGEALAWSSLGRVQWRQGLGERALSGFRTAQSLLRRAIERLGGTEPAFHRDLVAVLLQLAVAEQAAGNGETALSAATDAALLLRRRGAGGPPGDEPLPDPVARMIESLAASADPATADAFRRLAGVSAAQAARE